MDEHPSPEFEKELRETLGEPNANPVFVRDLRATLLERSTMKQKNRILPRLAWGFAIAILLSLLVVASPCALVLSIPSAVLAAIAWGARHGILFRGGAAVEKLAEATLVALDKTGTLTTGELRVERVESFPPGREREVAQLASLHHAVVGAFEITCYGSCLARGGDANTHGERGAPEVRLIARGSCSPEQPSLGIPKSSADAPRRAGLQLCLSGLRCRRVDAGTRPAAAQCR